MSITDKAQTAISDPSKVPPFIRRKTRQTVGAPFAMAHSRLRTRGLPAQKDRLDGLRREDSWLLIVLDACRYDMFVQQFPEVFEGRCEPVRSAGHDTFEYVSRCWSDQYPETTYVSGAVPVNSRAKRFDAAHFNDLYGGYVPAGHIGEIVDVWADEWDESLGICPPEAVVDRAMDRLDEDQLVAHVFQPHAPYIGDTQLLGHVGNEHARPGDGDPVDAPIWKAVRRGEVTDAQLAQAYRSNLRRAIRAVARLVEAADHDRIVIMGDHGEALGEWGLYCHPRIDHPHIRTVPWLEVEGVRIPATTDHGPDPTAEAATNAAVEQRLAELGYL